MKMFLLLCMIGSTMLTVFACTPSPSTAPPLNTTRLPSTEAPQQATVTPTIAPQSTTTVPPTPIPLDPTSFSLSETGPYDFGTRLFSFDDASRDNRHISFTVWYPSVRPENSTSNNPVANSPPDPSGAPYPVILTSTKSGRIFAPHLASHGFVVVGVNGMKASNWWGEWLIDYPLDLVFTLDHIATHSLEGLEGMIDADHAGAMGYSFGGYNALALSGARVDPEFYLNQCATASTMEPPPASWWIRYICEVSINWDDFAAHAGDALTASEDGLWQPLTDERILAVMSMAPEGAWLLGEHGLAEVDRPTLILGATMDDLNYYDLEAVFIFEHLGAPDGMMISFVGADHMMIYNNEQVAKMEHFMTAFFGYHLQGREEYQKIYSRDFVSQFEDLAWGVYSDK